MDDSNKSVTAGPRGELALIGAQRPAPHLTHLPRSESRPDPRRHRRVALALAALATPAFAQTTVPANWSFKPTGLTGGDQFRLLFLSSRARSPIGVCDGLTSLTHLSGACPAARRAFQEDSHWTPRKVGP